MTRQFPGTEAEWQATLIVAAVFAVAVVGSAIIEARRRRWTRRRVRSRLRGFVRRDGRWEEWP